MHTCRHINAVQDITIFWNIEFIITVSKYRSFPFRSFWEQRYQKRHAQVMKLPSDSCTCGLRSFTHWKDCASLHPLDFIKKAITNAADLVKCFDKISQISATGMKVYSSQWKFIYMYTPTFPWHAMHKDTCFLPLTLFWNPNERIT